MAQQLIDSFAGKFAPEKYEDTYREALCDVIKAKRAGKAVHVRAPEEEEAPADLLAALRASVQAAKRARAGGSPSRRAARRACSTPSPRRCAPRRPIPRRAPHSSAGASSTSSSRAASALRAGVKSSRGSA